MYKLSTEERYCRKCNTIKNISEFYKSNKTYCRECQNKCTHEWRLDNPLEWKVLNTLSRIKNTCKKKDIPYDLDAEWFRLKLKTGICEVTGIQFDFTLDKSKHGLSTLNAYSPTIDRVIPELGYIKENCVVCAWIYNRAKGEFSKDILDDFIKKYYESNIKE